MRLRILIAAAILLLASGCNPYDIEEILLPREDISLTWKGKDQFVYDPVTCQMSHNRATNEYRAHNDKLSDWFVIKCDEMPSYEGQEITADVSWTGDSSTRSEKGVTFTVEKTDASGCVWLWCKAKSIGIVIKNL